jgi:hypothetical protein
VPRTGVEVPAKFAVRLVKKASKFVLLVLSMPPQRLASVLLKTAGSINEKLGVVVAIYNSLIT